MGKVILTSRPSSPYDDAPGERYHFPQTYLRALTSAVGDWAVYYEPRRDGGRQSYVAAARITQITQDPTKSNHYYAWLSDFLEFPSPVPFRVSGSFYESGLRRSDGQVSKGAFGRSVRPLPEVEFANDNSEIQNWSITCRN